MAYSLKYMFQNKIVNRMKAFNGGCFSTFIPHEYCHYLCLAYYVYCYSINKLTGNLKEFWSVKVNKNYRIIFQFDGKDAFDLDYIDYH